MDKGYVLPSFPELTKEDIEQTFWGNQDFGLINEAMIKAVIELKDLNRKLANVERKRVKADLTHKHNYREAYLSQPEGRNETWKRNRAELECEDTEVALQYLEEISRELNRKASELRFELEALKNISFNIRQELRI